MAILYKYFGNRIIEDIDNFEDFILNPTLKLTPPQNLNDPFESFVAKDIQRHLKKNLNKKGSRLSRSLSEITYEGNFERGIKFSGIVSLTETSRNKLMWAHYATEHKGFVIGFDTSYIEASLIKYISNFNKRQLLTTKPIKVNYNSIRFDLINEAPTVDVNRDMLKLMLTTKSDDWIYEKEHRFIIPVELCDIIKPVKTSYFLEDIADDMGFEKICKGINKGGYRINKDFQWALDSNLEQMIDDVDFYKEIPTESIHSIHLGARVPSKTRGHIASFLFRKRLSNRVKLYRYEPNENYFELDAKEIHLRY
ncbi:TPA: DUF2971 domain-containing protein [Aeromonas hydrophila]|nr:DUF2971 domain-containing protein [Aeromonas hydrophila]